MEKMTIYDLVDRYGKGKGESVMWQSVRAISDMVDDYLPNDDREHVMKEIYESMQGEHFDEYFAEKQIEQMFFTDKAGVRHNAPYWNTEAVRSVYEQWRSRIKVKHTFCDFMVVMNMIYSDNYCLLKEWWPEISDEDLTRKIAEMSVNWLNDEDFGEGKAWRYFMMK